MSYSNSIHYITVIVVRTDTIAVRPQSITVLNPFVRQSQGSHVIASVASVTRTTDASFRPPPVLEMPATFSLELTPGQQVALDTTVSSDELDKHCQLRQRLRQPVRGMGGFTKVMA